MKEMKNEVPGESGGLPRYVSVSSSSSSSRERFERPEDSVSEECFDELSSSRVVSGSSSSSSSYSSHSASSKPSRSSGNSATFVILSSLPG